jgi:hypothetical protein
MRSRGTTATTTRPRPAEGDRANGGHKWAEKRSKHPAAPQHSTFRRVAVFVPLGSRCGSQDVGTLP